MLRVTISFITGKTEVHHCKSLSYDKFFLSLIYDNDARNSWFMFELKGVKVEYVGKMA